jgi:hypothetical protein
MATTLTKTARTILKSRLRRHPDALLIAQHIEGTYSKTNVSDLATSELVETARKFHHNGSTGMIPMQAEIDAFDAAKALGRDTNYALADADRTWTARNGNLPLPWANVNVAASRPLAMSGALGSDMDPDPVDVDDDTPERDAEVHQAERDAEERAAAAAEPKATTDAETSEAIDAEVKAIMGKMGAGDFTGYQDALKDLAARAHKPAEVRVVEVAAIDPSKIKGTVPKLTRKANMYDVGLPASLSGANPDATVMGVYDTPDAPRVDKLYQWHPHSAAMLGLMARGKNLFLTGPAGTGKTEFAKQAAARWGRRFIRISCDDQTEAATLVGMTVPDKDGGSKWQDGQLAAAIRVPGAIVLIDEPSVARPGALFVLQAVLDDDRRLHVAETGEVIPVAPDVVFLLADNTNGTGDVTGQYEATRRLNRATLDRCAVFVAFDYLDPAQETAVIAARSGLNKKAAAMLAKFAALTRQKAQGGDVSHGIGLRRLMALAECLAIGTDPSVAFQLSVIEGAPYDDKEPLRQLWTGSVDTNALSAAVKVAA